MFRHSQLESVKSWLTHPASAALPLHARIQRAIRQMILDGAIAPGRPLPASRALAVSLGVSRDTVEAAYTQLHAEGFIERRVGSGSFVADGSGFPVRPRRQSSGAMVSPPALSRRGTMMAMGGGVREAASPHPFAPGIPETRTFPLALWERLQRQVMKEAGTRALLHGDPQGVEPLRRAIADYVNLERGARASPDQVLVLTCAQQAMMLCATVLLDPGERIYLEDPAYYGARRAFEAAGLDCVPVPVDGQGITVAPVLDDPRPARALCLTPSHQFPTGATLALDRRLALIDWAARQQAWIIEDDYDSEFHYAGRPTACVQGLDPHGRTIYIGTFTKSLFPGLRIGYAVLPPHLVQPMTAARTLLDGHTAPLAQLTLARFMEGGHFGAHVRSMRSLYARRLDVLSGLVRRHLSGRLEAHCPAGGLQMACGLTDATTEQAAVEAARAAGVTLLGLSGLYADRNSPGISGFLLGFAAYTTTEMEEAVKALAGAFGRLRGAGHS
ncbi:MocR-like pyridoxine biosynthesis transcription factor PdxR [Novispirillum itersonii]|uniref:MocR-like pyridoxine biosynthesis transcription factor PdxR n=1 Tax=Novispirillum itersonii TaxID=189 RepID=UPI0003717022|nr:PLP-dependent aminotransferase family protein [Novispirillum itersonii]